MKKDVKIFILIVVISIAVLTAIDIQTKGKVTNLVGSVRSMDLLAKYVPYTNNSQSTVKGALDTLYTKANSIVIGKTNTVYFAYGEPTTSSTTDYTTLNKTVFLALNNKQKSVCIIRNGRLHCFDVRNWQVEKDHLQTVFSDITCSTYSVSGVPSSVTCSASDFYCMFGSNGQVYCTDAVQNKNSCQIYADDFAKCY